MCPRVQRPQFKTMSPMQPEKPKVTREPEEGSKETIRVRQGIGGQGVRYVLGFSLAAIVTAFLILAFYTSTTP